jgi:anti-anti-sigma factor
MAPSIPLIAVFSRVEMPEFPPLRTWHDANVVYLAGEVDRATVPQFRRALERCDEDPVVQALDLTCVDLFSAAGVGCLVERGWPTRPHPTIIASPAVRRVLDLSGLERLLDPHGWTLPSNG